MRHATETHQPTTQIKTTDKNDEKAREKAERFPIDRTNLSSATNRICEIARWAGDFDKVFIRWTTQSGRWNTSNPYVCDAPMTIVSAALNGCTITDIEFLGSDPVFVDENGKLVRD